MRSIYSVQLTNLAQKSFKKIYRGTPHIARQIGKVIDKLLLNPQMGQLLHGDLKGRRKVRVGDYRLVYTVEKKKLIIYLLTIAHRKDAYR